MKLNLNHVFLNFLGLVNRIRNLFQRKLLASNKEFFLLKFQFGLFIMDFLVFLVSLLRDLGCCLFFCLEIFYNWFLQFLFILMTFLSFFSQVLNNFILSFKLCKTFFYIALNNFKFLIINFSPFKNYWFNSVYNFQILNQILLSCSPLFCSVNFYYFYCYHQN